MSTIRMLPLPLILAWLPLSCAESTQQPPSPPPAPPAPAPAAEPDASQLPGKDANKGMVEIDPAILELCDIPTPHFAFDSSALSAEAGSALDALATCFVSGKAAGKNMNLVGHADPRGTEEYNLALGQRRADSVASHLKTRGLGDDRLETSSRGELDATGSDEASWALDRKVQIFLAE